MKGAKVKNKTFWILFIIVFIGTCLRLAFIDKPDGLWNDEYVSWFIASVPLGKDFIHSIFEQCHMPFYYLYLKFFIHFFGNSDLMLRVTSVIPGILSIISMYFVGKELKDKKLGYFCSLITAISSFLIYFSQEVRFYGILFLFSSLALLFTLKLLKKQSLKNIVFYIIFSFLIIFTHTIGFVFVVFNSVFLSLYLAKKDECKKTLSILLGSTLILLLLGLPLIYNFLTTRFISQWWGTFNFSRIGFMLTDYFSPVLTNIVSAPDNFSKVININFFIFAIIPSIIALIGIIRSLIAKKIEIFIVFFTCLAYIFSLIIAAISGKLVFASKYSIEVYPTLILLMCSGLLTFKSKLKYILIILYCFLSLLYMYISPIGAPKIRRSEGHKIVADLIKNADLRKNDIILLNYYPQSRFEKYINFKDLNVISINKSNFAKYLNITAKEDLANINKKYFLNKINNEIINELKPNQKLSLVLLNTVTLYSPNQIHYLFHNKKEYDKAPFLFLAFSYIKNKEINEFITKLKILRYEEKGSWSVITFIKK